MTTPIIIRSAIFIILTLQQISAFKVPHKRFNINELNEFRIPRAENLRAFINESVDPCFDFYDFACGNWKTFYPATENAPITSPTKTLEETINKQLQVLLEENVLTTDGQFERKVKDFYFSCMDNGNSTQSIKQVFMDIVKKNSGMPAVQSHWNERSYNWVTQASNLRRKFGLNIMMELNIKSDTSNQNISQIYIREPSTLIPKHICKKGDFENSRYSELKTEITDNMAYWFDMDKIEGLNFATDLLNFETFLCRGMSDDFSNITFISLNELNSMFPKIMFSDFVQTSFGQQIKQPVYLQDNDYFEHLSKVIRETPKRSIANYIMYRALNDISFPEEYNNEKHASLCVDECVKHFPKEVGEMYNKNNSLLETKKDMELMLMKLKETFKVNIDSQLWIEETTRKQAISKIFEIKFKFPDYLTDFKFQDHISLNIERRNFWKNILTLMELEQQNEKKQLYPDSNLRPSVDNKVESFSIKTEYNPIENEIRMPLGFLQPPIYHGTAPNAYKYGILGFFIARELIHSLDENGWSDLNSTLEYQERASCYREQYVTYTENDSALSPEEVEANILEFIADSGALNISFNAYLEWLHIWNSQILYDETLSNVDYTNTQLFFISFAQNFCSDAYLKDEPIFPWDVPDYLEKFRVNSVLWNMDEFSREFNCLPATEMNPGEKCNLY